MTLRVVQYYPRAVSGDGGMTGAVHRLHAVVGSAPVPRRRSCSIPVDRSAIRPRASTASLFSHVGTENQRLPRTKALRDAFRGSDLVVVHSGFAPHNVAATRVSRQLGIPYVVAPRGAYDPHIFGRRPRMKRLWWRYVEFPMVERARAVHNFFAEQNGRPGTARISRPRAYRPERCRAAARRAMGRRHGRVRALARPVRPAAQGHRPSRYRARARAGRTSGLACGSSVPIGATVASG